MGVHPRAGAALDQARATASLPFVVKPLALMPDAHVGIGATVGSVIPTRNAVIPAAVGVDIGCGMIAAEARRHRRSGCPTSLSRPPSAYREGRPRRGRTGAHEGTSRAARGRGLHRNRPATDLTHEQTAKGSSSSGTLGAGNHFFELCL